MTAEIATQLEVQEAVITAGMATFVDVGVALQQIRANRLYRESHKTFEDYCRVRWGWTRQHANRVISSAGVALNLEPMGSISHNERQLRVLVELPAAQQREVWQEVVDAGPVTARAVQAAVDRRQPLKQAKARRGLPSLHSWLGTLREYRERIDEELDRVGDDALAYLSSEERREFERTVAALHDWCERWSVRLTERVRVVVDEERSA